MTRTRFAWFACLTGLGVGVATACGLVNGSQTGSDNLEPVERDIVGSAQPYPADPNIAAQEQQLRTSKAARRATAWQIVGRILQPVQTAANIPTAQIEGGANTLPLFRTWYDRDDFTRVFRKLYSDAGPAARKARQPFSQDTIDAAIQWNDTSTGASSEQDYFNRIANVVTNPDLQGLASNYRVVYSPAFINHLLNNYAPIHDCGPKLASMAPFSTPPPSSTNFAACYSSEFPSDAVMVKQSWWRADFGKTLPTHDTSAATLAANLASPDGGWGDGGGAATPDPSSIYTVSPGPGYTFRLAAIHIATKELRHWFWITLYWSPDPNSDFGQDRPAAIANLPGPWANYKMNTVTWYEEEDPDPRGGFSGSLGDALAAVHSPDGGPTWCSDPYIEKGAHNAQTNCIGCHQHSSLPNLGSEAILSDPTTYPMSGRTELRQAFVSDYTWSLESQPEDLAFIIDDEIQDFDLSDPK